MNRNQKSFTLALGSACVFSLLSAPTIQAAENPFGLRQLQGGYLLADAKDAHKQAEAGKCGEGKCGGKKSAKSTDGKCGEGKCGGKKEAKSSEGKCGEGKCGGKKAVKASDGKCGEGKCGGKK